MDRCILNFHHPVHQPLADSFKFGNFTHEARAGVSCAVFCTYMPDSKARPNIEALRTLQVLSHVVYERWVGVSLSKRVQEAIGDIGCLDYFFKSSHKFLGIVGVKRHVPKVPHRSYKSVKCEGNGDFGIREFFSLIRSSLLEVEGGWYSCSYQYCCDAAHSLYPCGPESRTPDVKRASWKPDRCSEKEAEYRCDHCRTDSQPRDSAPHGLTSLIFQVILRRRRLTCEAVNAR